MNNIMRFDIETCPEALTAVEWAKYTKRTLWEKKAETNDDIDGTFDNYLKKAGLYAEFSKVCCVSFKVGDHISTHSIKNMSEAKLLETIASIFDKNTRKLGGFNIYNFDIPFLRKRFIVNGMIPPKALSIGGIKPREIDNILVDVFQIWKQTSFSCSLDLLSLTLLGESPKSDGSGENVAFAIESKNFERVEKYCQSDVDYTERCYDIILDPTKLIPQNNKSNLPQFGDSDLQQLAQKKIFISSFKSSNDLITEIEKSYEISQEKRMEIADLRANADESNNDESSGLPF